MSVVFQRITHLDFRVYRVKDPAAFFAGLKDPHMLGSPEYDVAQEPTLIERIAMWKARWRASITDFFRQQVTWDYRQSRRAEAAAGGHRPTAHGEVHAVRAAAAAEPRPGGGHVARSAAQHAVGRLAAHPARVEGPRRLRRRGGQRPPARVHHRRARPASAWSRRPLRARCCCSPSTATSGEPKADCATTVIANQQTLATGKTGRAGRLRRRMSRRTRRRRT